MRTLFLLALLAASTASHGASDYAITWSLDQPLVSGTTSYTQMQLDLNVGSRFYTGNGGLITPSNLISPLTGTCFDTSSSGVYCNVQLDQETLNIVISSNGNGFIEHKNSLGNIVETIGITILSVQ